MKCALPDLESTSKFAATIAKQLESERSGSALLLSGELGSGKTTLARHIIHHIMPEVQKVISPTFPIVQEYKRKDGLIIAHYDLYRLKREEELSPLNLAEHLRSSICIIEWPELASSYLSDYASIIYTIYLSFDHTKQLNNSEEDGIPLHEQDESDYLDKIGRVAELHCLRIR